MKVDNITIGINGKTLLLRNAIADDAAMLIDYLKTVNTETRFLRYEPEEICYTVEQECEFIENVNTSKSNIMLLAFLDGAYIGNCSYAVDSAMRVCHRATLGIALYGKYTGMGIGGVMINALCDIARKNGIEQMELEVVSDNINAIALYEKLGFVHCGSIPNANKYKDGTYSDEIRMFKRL